MTTFATPGVTVEEVTGIGAIAGVGTSTAGFIGPTLRGPILVPTRVTSWEQFEQLYGRPRAQPGPGPAMEVYITDPKRFLAHAVRGFFDNGGSQAYVCRVGTAARAFRDLPPVAGAAAGDALRIEAREEGVAGNNLTVAASHSSLSGAVNVARPTGTSVSSAQGRRIAVADAREFRPGDIVRRSTAPATERLEVERIDYATNEVFVTSDVVGNMTGNLLPARLIPGQRRFRLQSTDNLFPGSIVTVARGGISETATVAAARDGFVTLERGLTNEYLASGALTTLTSREFDLTVAGGQAGAVPFTGLSTSRRHPRYFERMVDSPLVRAMPGDQPTMAMPPDDRPAITGALALQFGADDDVRAIGGSEFSAGIDAFEAIDDVNFLCLPDAQDIPTQQALRDHCTRMKDRIAVLDVPQGLDPAGAQVHRGAVQSENGFAALYYPWLVIADPLSSTGETLTVPPCGHVGGIYARVDENPGVHKAPANEAVRGAIGLERVLSDRQQAPLNLAGVNTIRVFAARATPIVWGARTTVDPVVTDWLYVNVRRLLCYIEESIQESLRQAVFRPNDLALWQQLKRTITAFLTGVWRDGALFGATAEQAFQVRIDSVINPPDSIALGRLFIELKVAPVRPAEFIVVRIALFEGGDTEAIEV